MKSYFALAVFIFCTLLRNSSTQKPANATVGRELSSEEVEEHRKDFVDFDLNSDGQIDAHEIRSSFKNDIQPKELYKFFDDVDTDKTGTVTLDEYLKYAATMD